MKIKRQGFTLHIFEDDVDSPREYDKDFNIGHMICFHSRLNLGDEHEFKNPQEFQEWYKKNKRKIVAILPLYLLDHSGLSISTTPFNDPWDSGQVGYIYCTKEDLKKQFLSDDEEKEYYEQILDDEVILYDQWLSGEPPYYAFRITDENDNLVCCQGVYSDDDLEGVIEKMKSDIGEEYHFLFNGMLKELQSSYL